MQSKPNRFLGVRVAKQAEFDAHRRAHRLVEPARRGLLAVPAARRPARRPPGSSVHGGVVRFQTGLEYVNGKPKPLYFGWPLPLVGLQARARLLALGARAPTLGPPGDACWCSPRARTSGGCSRRAHRRARANGRSAPACRAPPGACAGRAPRASSTKGRRSTSPSSRLQVSGCDRRRSARRGRLGCLPGVALR